MVLTSLERKALFSNAYVCVVLWLGVPAHLGGTPDDGDLYKFRLCLN